MQLAGRVLNGTANQRTKGWARLLSRLQAEVLLLGQGRMPSFRTNCRENRRGRAEEEREIKVLAIEKHTQSDIV